VRGEEEGAQRLQVGGAQRGDGLADARVLADDVTHAAGERLGKRGHARDGVVGWLAERPDAEQRRGALALVPARIVVAGGVAVRDTRVDHEEPERRRQRHGLVREAPRVKEERRAGAREARGHLVHHADARADEVVLRPMGDERQGDVVERQGERGPERAQERHLERRARREAAAERQRGGDARVEAAERRLLGEDAGAALDVVEPVARA